MKFEIPSKMKVGAIDYDIQLVEHCGLNDDFGVWFPQGFIQIATKAGGYDVPESRQRQSFWHELVHSILDQMGKEDLNEDESFVNTFSSFLSGAVDSMIAEPDSIK